MSNTGAPQMIMSSRNSRPGMDTPGDRTCRHI